MTLSVKKTEVKHLIKALQKSINTKDDLLDDVADIYLQFTVKKIPNKLNKKIKIKLPHGLHKKNTDICLFVKDLDRKSREHEITQDHFKDLLKSKGVDCISEIIPLKALKLEYRPFEAKRNLSQNYDLYLADERIVKFLPSLLGKHFYGRNRLPVQVDLGAKDLKTEIDNAINNTRCIMNNKGSCSWVRVAHFDMKTDEIVENVMSALETLAKSVPGGADNFRNMFIKTPNSMALPIYMSMGTIDKVDLQEPEGKAPETVIEDITTLENGLVKVTPEGEVQIVDEEGKSLEKKQKRKNFISNSRKSKKRRLSKT